MSVPDRFTDSKIIIATHVFATGPAQDLRQFLVNERASKLLFLTHPLWPEPYLAGSGYEYYEQGILKRQAHGRLRKIPDVLSYVKDFILNILFVSRWRQKWDLYIGCNNLNALSGLLLRRLGLVRKTVYYTIDYNPQRFQSTWLNRVYHQVDQFCVLHADETWNTTQLVEQAREKYFGFCGGKQKVVPIGIWLERFPRVPATVTEQHTTVFMGSLVERQGVQKIIAAVPLIIKHIPDFKLLVIGRGPYAPQLARQVHDLAVDKYVQFTGYIEKHEDLEKLLVRCALAVVMYCRHDDQGSLNFVYFGDPGKIKSYLASGLPIVMNDFAYNAGQLEHAGCAEVLRDDNTDTLASTVVGLLQDEKKLQLMRGKALLAAQDSDWRRIFTENLSRVLRPVQN